MTCISPPPLLCTGPSHCYLLTESLLSVFLLLLLSLSFKNIISSCCVKADHVTPMQNSQCFFPFSLRINVNIFLKPSESFSTIPSISSVSIAIHSFPPSFLLQQLPWSWFRPLHLRVCPARTHVSHRVTELSPSAPSGVKFSHPPPFQWVVPSSPHWKSHPLPILNFSPYTLSFSFFVV